MFGPNEIYAPEVMPAHELLNDLHRAYLALVAESLNDPVGLRKGRRLALAQAIQAELRISRKEKAA